MGFSLYERQYLGIHGLIPPAFMTQEQQAYRVICKLREQPNDLARYIQLDGLQDRNEKLFYRYFGRSVAYFVHYCSFILFYHIVVYNIFDFPRRGEWLPMAVFAVVFLFSTINFGMVVSQIFLRRETSMQIFLFLSMPVLFLGNFSWPLYLMPNWMQAIAYAIPSTFAIPAWLAIEQRGADIYDAAALLYPMAIQGVFYMILGLVMTRIRDKSTLIKTGDM